MTDAPELLPCPFCGCQKASVLPCNSDWIRKHRIYPIVRCGGCYLDLPGKNDDFSEDGKTAVAAWNTRSTNQQALDAAREEGRRVGLEQAANWVENAAVTETWEWPEYIRARIDTPADPVAEAARVLLNDMRVTTMFCAAMFAGEDPPKSYADADAWVCKTLRALAQKEGE